MSIMTVLVANRGEIAIRVMRAAAELGMRTAAVFSQDDAASLHTRRADQAHALRGVGASAYLDGEQLVALATERGYDAIHPGYGFLSENARFAQRCADAGITFVGPRPEVLDLFGDKVQARALAQRCGVPLLAGTGAPVSLDDAREFMLSLPPGSAVMLKAVAGGGGRGMRVVTSSENLDEAYDRCQSEALQSFGNPDLYAEQLIARARHIEVQVIGDGSGAVSHLGERECTVQRRHQKLVEVAPSPELSPTLRDELTAAAVRMAEAVRYDSLGTVEFLVDAGGPAGARPSFAFIEANPRVQVEHTVTEEVTGIDLVKSQLRLACGETLESLGLLQDQVPAPRGFAMQIRVNTETMTADGSVKPSGGTITAFDAPSGPGIRIDASCYVGYRTSPSFDSLIAKVIAHSTAADYTQVVAKAYRALCETRIDGVATNIAFLQNLLQHPDFVANHIYTRFIEDHASELVPLSAPSHQRLYFETEREPVRAGALVDPNDPLAVLRHGAREGSGSPTVGMGAPKDQFPSDGTSKVEAHIQGTIVSLRVSPGDVISPSTPILVMEAMKMEHMVPAGVSGVVQSVLVAVGDTVFEGHPLAYIEVHDIEVEDREEAEVVDLDYIRPDLAEVMERQAMTRDAARPDAVQRRRKTGQRTTRENVEDLFEPGSFVEYGALVIAAQRQRRPLDELIVRTPADGLVAGTGTVNGHLFDSSRTECIALSYDYTVLAGTQGRKNHIKKDRMFELAERARLPVVFFTEGGGGRPGDTDGKGVAGLDVLAFHLFGKLSGTVPLVGITSGRCFAGNAALLGCCDVVIATKGSSIGMGGPAMIEGGGLGIFRPEEVGPMEVQVPNGVVDILVEDEAEAVAVAKKYLSYFQGSLSEWECADQRLLRSAIPENRLQVYDVRTVIETLADTDSVLELRRGFGLGMVTALMRIEGRPMGVIANNPTHLAGAIDSDAADKAARFLQLCDAFDLPVLSLCDTPGMMVGPEVEKTALVRHCSRLFVTGANLRVPMFTIVLRKAYGLGAQAMAGGSFRAPFFSVSWPTGEFGGMGLEGAVKLGYRNELAAIEDPGARKASFDQMVAEMYEKGKAVNTATHFELDDVIDPMESRGRIVAGLRAHPPGQQTGQRRAFIDTW